MDNVHPTIAQALAPFAPPAVTTGTTPMTQTPTLDAFTQGYTDAMIEWCRANCIATSLRNMRFSDLAPETLARIMEDCAAYATKYRSTTREQGAAFWAARLAPTRTFCGWNPEFPPLTTYLGDDGKIHLREAL